ncbi:hypothetical protein [Cellulomonas composti]|uniref:Uncharacterized protein n=1 Tax=Cellulomonas composti TaxID=266130 RepID=A0A511JBF9_9CELL|nr:hypothetical protein [Cellulomonas composti]GEL95316.1 hypothetical protein CCO02nite_19740 [Cellulomonas composti]
MTESGQPSQDGPVWSQTGPSGSTPPATPPAGPVGTPPPAGGSGRPAWLLPVAIVVAVLLVAGVVVGIVLANRGGDETAEPPVAITTILPVPTPDVEPVARTATTPFAQTLPDAVLQYALASSDPAPQWVDAGALEAYQETYTDGAGAEVTMLVGQWATGDEAKAFYQAQLAELPGAAALSSSDTDSEQTGSGNAGSDEKGSDKGEPSPAPTRTQSGDVTAQGDTARDKLPQTGAVRVGDKRVGTYTAVDKGDGTGIVLWFNRTAVFRAVVPVADVLDFYRAFPV